MPALLAAVAPHLIGAGLSWWNNRNRAKGYEKAGAAAAGMANQGFNYLAGSPIGQTYLPAGGAAVNAQQGLLGIGGDPAAADEAFRNYQESTGFQGQMRAGEQAITGSAAARGLLGSGSTAKALTRYGQQLGAQSFNNYLGQLGGVADRGLQAGGMVGQAATAGGMAGAQHTWNGMTGATDARAQGWDDLFAGVGGAFDAYGAMRRGNAGRLPWGGNTLPGRVQTPPNGGGILQPVPDAFARGYG